MEPIEMFNFSTFFQIFNFSIFFVIRKTNCPTYCPTKKKKSGVILDTRNILLINIFFFKLFSELVENVSSDLLPDMSIAK